MGGSGWAVKLWSVTQAELRENNLLVPQLWLLPTLPATHTSSRLLTAEPACFTGVKTAALG